MCGHSDIFILDGGHDWARFNLENKKAKVYFNW